MSAKVRTWACVGWCAMALIFGLIGWFFAIKPIAFATGNWQQTRDYQLTPATVAQRTGKDAEGEFKWYAAQYRVGERLHETARLTILDDEDIDEPSNEAVLKTLEDAFSRKQPVNVWVSPRKPEIAVVSRDLPVRSLWARIPMAIVFSIFTVAGVMGALGCIGNFAYYRRMIDASGAWIFAALWCGFVYPMMALVGSSKGGDGIAVAVIGFFALIGALILYVAVTVSLFGARESGAGNAASPANRKQAPSKRAGFGGRGDDFDKD